MGSDNLGTLQNSNQMMDAAVNLQTHDMLPDMIVIPATKLDADQYSAEDIDGVTESLFGSGNMNYLLMQAGQTNAALSVTDPLLLGGGDALSSHTLPSFALAAPQSDTANDRNGQTTDTDRSIGLPIDGQNEANASDGHFSNVTVGSLEAAGTAVSGAGIASLSTVSGGSGGDGVPLKAEDGKNGTSGTDGSNGNGTTIVNLGDTTIDLGDITEDVTNIVNNTTDNVTEIVNNVTENITDTINNTLDSVTNLIDLNEITNNVTDVVNNLTNTLNLGDVNETVTNVVNTVSDTLNTVTDIVNLGDVGGTVTNIVNVVTDTTDDLLGGLLGGGGEADTDLALGIDSGLLDTGLVDQAQDILFNPVEDLVGDIDIGGQVGLDLLGNNETSNAAGDSDLTLGLDTDLINSDLLGGTIDIPLDPVEAITGDIDLNLNVSTDLLGESADGLIDTFNGGTGEDTLLSDAGNLLSDTTADILPDGGGTGDDLQLDLIDSSLGDAVIDAPLDPLDGLTESLNTDLTGGIDDTLGSALDLLTQNQDLSGTLSDPLSDPLGDTSQTNDTSGDLISWTESTIPDAGSLLSDSTALGGNTGDVLPDPTGSVTEGLGGLLGGATDSGSLLQSGGLFG